MTFNTKIISLTIGLFISSVSCAFKSDIKLDNIQVPPGKTVGLVLNKLLPDVEYEVICILTSDGKSGEKQDQVRSDAFNRKANSHYFDPYIFDVSTSGATSFLARDVYLHRTANFQNLDDTDTIIVSNCVAKVYVHNKG